MKIATTKNPGDPNRANNCSIKDSASSSRVATIRSIKDSKGSTQYNDLERIQDLVTSLGAMAHHTSYDN